MKFGSSLKKRSNKEFFLRIYFIVGLLLISLAFIVYTNLLMKNVKRDVQLVPDLYAKFISAPDDLDLEDFLIQYFMSNIVPKINYPIILADSLNVPFSWENIEIEQINFKMLSKENQLKIRKMMKKMAKMKNVIPIKKNFNDKNPFSYLYFGESKSMFQLRMLPYFEILILAVFILLGIWGILIIKKHESDNLWIGLAKETAHQFGTPISSLMGWIDILQLKFKEIKADEDIMLMLKYMKADIERLNYIASRFGKVGSMIELKSQKIDNIITDIVDYFSKRLPGFDAKINLEYSITNKDLKAYIDESLFRWALENVIKNGIDAMTGKKGSLKINISENSNAISIKISDEGIGIPKSMQKKIFSPGVTSKKRGWGLGLSLAKRIIEEYHKGKIHVLKSEPNEGTTIEIILPKKI